LCKIRSSKLLFKHLYIKRNLSEITTRYAQFLVIFTLFTFSGLNSVHVLAEDLAKAQIIGDKPLKISMIAAAPPFNIELEDGRKTGLYVDFWRLWAKYSNIEVEFVSGKFEKNIEDLKNHKVDFHSGLFKSTERLNWAEFSIPIHQVNTSLYFYEKHHAVLPLSEMVGKKVAVPSGSYQASYFINRYPNIKFVQFTDNYNVVNDLLDGKFDALIGEEPYVDNLLARQKVNGILLKSSEKLLSNLVYALFPKGKSDLVKLVNDGIKSIPINEIIELENKWLPTSKPFFEQLAHNELSSLTLNEINLIKDLPTLNVGSDPNWPPIEFKQDEIFQGVAIDYLELIRNKLNINFNHLAKPESIQLVEKAGDREIQLLSAVAKAEDIDDTMTLTESYTNFQVVVMLRPDTPLLNDFQELQGLMVGAVLEGELRSILEKNHPNLPIKNMSNTLQALKDLSDGKIDAYIGNHFMIAHSLEQLKNEGLKVGLFTDYSLHLKMEIHDKYKKLVPIFNKLFASISNREKIAILNRWKGNEIIEINDQFEQFLVFGIPTFIAILALLIYSAFINRKMTAEINTRIRNEKKIQSEKLIADQANRAKDDFLANMSHELRSPMNAIVGTSFLLNNSILTESQKSLVDVMDSSAKNLLRLINNILDLSKIEASKLKLEKHPIDLTIFCHNLFSQELLENSLNKSVKANIYIDINIPNNLLFDSHRLTQILTNLLVNAKKHTKDGGITLRVSQLKNTSSSKSKKVSISFEIIDTGIGIGEKQQEKIFSNFNQTDTSLTRSNSGAGLGLKLTDALCKLMGSELCVESHLDKGSRFYFTVETEVQNNTKQINEKLNGMRIMIVDDNPVNLIVTKKAIEKLNAKVIIANSGSEALNMIEKDSVQVILMDMYMPEMDGVETCIEIRKTKSNQEIPIFAFSASSDEAEKARAKASGMNGYLNKPIEVEELIRVLSNELN